MSCSLLLANDNRIKEFNKIYHNYVLYAKILSKRVFAYLVTHHSIRIATIYLQGIWTLYSK